MAYGYSSQKNIDRIAERDGGYFCHYCGCALIESNRFARKLVYKDSNVTIYKWEYPPGKKMVTVDHVIPRILGGSNHIDNLVLACRNCNSKKSVGTLEAHHGPR